MTLNADYPWDEFDSVSYLAHNYNILRDDDRQFLELVRDYFAANATEDGFDGVDVGSGSNLYPALALLPWCKRITLVEHSARNATWLTGEIQHFAPNWDPFWKLLAENPHYQAITDPRPALAQRAEVEKGSVFELPKQRWGIGTMFFVAESISSRHFEFEEAVDRFIGALLPGAPFAAAFMEGSEGYTVGDRSFPAVAIGTRDVRACLEGRTSELLVDRVGLVDNALRSGYTGMVLARGRTRSV